MRENRTWSVNIKMTSSEHSNLKKNLQDGQSISNFVRRAISNELERLELYKKEKNQTWDLD